MSTASLPTSPQLFASRRLSISSEERRVELLLDPLVPYNRRREIQQILQNPRQLLEDRELRQHVLKRLRSLDTKVSAALDTTATEKAFYAASLCTIFAAGLVVGKYPDWFHVFYSALFVVLMPIRFYTYFKLSYHYFLADLCYFVNILLMVWIWILPGSQLLYTTLFSFLFATLSWGVIMWRNSLVLHLIEKTTSLFIHIIPPVTLYVVTHLLEPEYKQKRFAGAAGVTHWNIVSSIAWTLLYYLVWQVAYHYFITVRKSVKIKNGSRATLFEWLRRRYAKTVLGRFVNSLPEPLAVFAFMLIQYGYQMATMVLVPVWFQYSAACAGFLMFITLVAAFNGATYYVDVFGNRFQKELKKLQEEIKRGEVSAAPMAQTPSTSAASVADDNGDVPTSPRLDDGY